jgi:hypothetical protein
MIDAAYRRRENAAQYAAWLDALAPRFAQLARRRTRDASPGVPRRRVRWRNRWRLRWRRTWPVTVTSFTAPGRTPELRLELVVREDGTWRHVRDGRRHRDVRPGADSLGLLLAEFEASFAAELDRLDPTRAVPRVPGARAGTADVLT